MVERIIGLEAIVMAKLGEEKGLDFVNCYRAYINSTRQMKPTERRDYFIKQYDILNKLQDKHEEMRR
jgi:hypothetical protein